MHFLAINLYFLAYFFKNKPKQEFMHKQYLIINTSCHYCFLHMINCFYCKTQPLQVPINLKAIRAFQDQ